MVAADGAFSRPLSLDFGFGSLAAAGFVVVAAVVPAAVGPAARPAAVGLAVAHEEFRNFTMKDINNLLGNDQKVLLDLKGLLNRSEYEAAGYIYWRL